MNIKTSINFASDKNRKKLELKDIVSISGKPGLNLIVGKRPNGLIVETIDNQKKRYTTTLNQKVSILEDISIYTTDGDVKLAEVLKSLDKEYKSGLTLVNKKSTPEEIKSFFTKVLPNYDDTQVYNSDIIKVSMWFELLKDLINFEEVTVDQAGDSAEKVVSKTEKTSKPKISAAKGVKTSTQSANVKAPKLTQRKMS